MPVIAHNSDLWALYRDVMPRPIMRSYAKYKNRSPVYVKCEKLHLVTRDAGFAWIDVQGK